VNDSSTLRNDYLCDGVVFRRGLLSSSDLRMVEAAYDWMLAEPNPTKVEFYPREPARFLQASGCSPRIAEFERVLHDTPVAALCAELFGDGSRPGAVWYLGEQLFLKDGGAARRTPWHQDSSYLPFAGAKLAVVWICLDRLPREAALEVVRGPHRGITYNGSMFDPNDDTAPLYAKSDLPRLPDIEADRRAWDIVGWEIEPGDVLVFHTACLHGGAATTPDLVRRTLSLRFFGDDVAWIGRPERTDRLKGRPQTQRTAGELLATSGEFVQVYPPDAEAIA
jgi:hypothetical protein